MKDPLCNQILIVIVIIIVDQFCNQPTNQESSCQLKFHQPSSIIYANAFLLIHLLSPSRNVHPLNHTFEDHGVISQLFSHITRRGARDLRKKQLQLQVLDGSIRE